MAANRPIAFTGARVVDPDSGYDGPGCLVVANGLIAEVVRQPAYEGLSTDIEVIACNGAMLAPGLVDIRVKTGEPGAETKETLKSAARAAVAGGVTSIVVQPDTDPVVDEPSVGLAPILVSRTIDKIKELKDRYQLTVLMAEQNFHQAIRIADRGYVIESGRIVHQGSAAEIRDDPALERAYLGHI